MTTMTAVSAQHEAAQIAAQIVFEYEGWNSEHVEQMHGCAESGCSIGAVYEACFAMQILKNKGVSYDDAINEVGRTVQIKTKGQANMKDFIKRNGIEDKWTMNHLANIVNGVRSDDVLGRGSCSSIDETFTDSEVLELVCMVEGSGGEFGIMKKRLPSVAQAVKIAREYEKKMMELELECQY